MITFLDIVVLNKTIHGKNCPSWGEYNKVSKYDKYWEYGYIVSER